MTNIEWTDRTWNPVIGCTRVSEGCRHCYAERMSQRLAAMADAEVEQGNPPSPRKQNYTRVVKYRDGHPLPQWSNKVVCVDEALSEPMRWRKPSRVFVNSMSDLFHEDVPFKFVHKVWDVMKACPKHRFQILTKRPERMVELVTRIYKMEALGHAKGFWDHVWLGTSCEDQATADERIPHLLRCPAAVRFLSLEPLLGAIDLTHVKHARIDINPDDYRRHGVPVPSAAWATTNVLVSRAADKLNPEKPGIDHVIIGGESGPGARSCNIEWIRSIVEQCRDAGVPVFVKQLGSNVRIPHSGPPTGLKCARQQDGEWRAILKDSKGGDPTEWPEDLRVRQMPEVMP